MEGFDRVHELIARRRHPRFAIFGRMAILADPDGAVFAVIDHSRTLDDVGRAEVDDPYDD